MSEPARPLVRWGLLAFVASWIASLGFRGLYNPDEGRYAEIPREILASGDWVVPHLNGLVYIEKPPLQYWATALSYVLFGQSAWSARLYTGLAGLGTILVTAWLARRLWGKAAAWRAGIMLASSLMLMVMSHQLMLDMSLTFFMTLTLAAFCAAQHGETDTTTRARLMWLAWASTAAAFLTKGLVAGVIPVLSLVGYSLLQRDFAPWKRLHIGVGLVLWVLIAAPWVLLIQHRLPQFFDFFFVREHFKRFSTLIEQRYQPWWFFLEILVIGSLPWLVPMMRGLASGWRGAPAGDHFDPRRLLWVWSIVVLVFFSLSHSKLIPYILPMFPPLALLAASLPEERLRKDLRVTGAGLLLVGAICLSGAVLLPHWLHDPTHPTRVPYFLKLRAPLVAMGLVALAGGVWTWRTRGASLPLTAAIGTTSYVFFGGVLWAAVLLAPVYSGEVLVRGLDPSVARTATIYSVRTYDQSLPFYLGHTVTLVDYRGELDFGLTLEPHKLVPLAKFEFDWLEAPQALAVMELDTYALMVRHNLPMVVRGRSAGELLVSRR